MNQKTQREPLAGALPEGDTLGSPLSDEGLKQPKAHDPNGPDGMPTQRTRIPFGEPQAKLSIPPEPGFVIRWFNDTRDRLWRAERAGYTFCKEKKTNARYKRTVGVQEGGAPLIAYAMKIPQEFYDEDFAAKQAVNDEIDMAMYRGTYQQEKGDARYVPRGGIKMKSSHRSEG